VKEYSVLFVSSSDHGRQPIPDVVLGGVMLLASIFFLAVVVLCSLPLAIKATPAPSECPIQVIWMLFHP
jgi:hypothetical protein